MLAAFESVTTSPLSQINLCKCQLCLTFIYFNCYNRTDRQPPKIYRPQLKKEFVFCSGKNLRMMEGPPLSTIR